MFDPREANCPDCGCSSNFIPCWRGSLMFDFPTIDAQMIMNREGKWNY